MDPQSWQQYGEKMDPELAKILPFLPRVVTTDFPDVPSLREAMTKMLGQLVASGSIQMPDLSGVSKRDVEVPMRDGAFIRAVLYKPEQAHSQGPLAVLFYGGGWCVGAPENMEQHSAYLVKTFGAVVVAPDYRKAPENVFPTAPNDAWDSVKWAAANASQLGADPLKGFIVGGASAGATLSTVVAHLARDEKLSPPLTGVYLNVPYLVHRMAVPEKYKPYYLSMQQMKNAPVLPVAALDRMTKWYQSDPKSPLASPLLWPSGHKNLPPVYLQVSGMDVLRDEALIFEHHLRKEADVKTKLDIYPGLPHAGMYFMPQLALSKKAWEDSEDGLKWLLEQ